MEFHHIQSASTTNGSLPADSSIATDDLEIDAAQGGANKVICLALPHANWIRELPIPHRQGCHTCVDPGHTVQLLTGAGLASFPRQLLSSWLAGSNVPYGEGLPGTQRQSG